MLVTVFVAQLPAKCLESERLETEVSRTQALKVADSVGLKSEFTALINCSEQPEQDLACAQALRRLWQVEFELKRILLETSEEKTALCSIVTRTRNKRESIANSLDSANFLSTSIIALVGNCIFIPAPPPPPVTPNILFSIANGISMGMSCISVAALNEHSIKLATRSNEILRPFFSTQFYPEHSGRVWHYLNYSIDGTETPRNRLLAKWQAFKLAEKIKFEGGISIVASESTTSKVSLEEIEERIKMLEDLENELLKMTRSLSGLGHYL